MTTKEERPSLSKATETLQSVARPIINFVTVALPFIVQVCQTLYGIYVKLPIEAFRFIVGFVFCFFGGVYPTLFAAITAAKHGGLRIMADSVKAIVNEAMTIIEESKKDDAKDDDGDGVADVDQIDGKELLLRKAKLVLTKMNPEKVDTAISNFNKVWISVLAVLKIQFARTIALALSISDFLKNPIDRFLAPTIQSAVPKEYSKWVPVVLGWIAKSIAMSIAWTLQAMMSAFSSALEGGLIMARTLLQMCINNGITLNGLIPEKHEDSRLDEYLSYFFAASGFLFQLYIGFDVTFPFNILLFPFEIAEYYIRWTITE